MRQSSHSVSRRKAASEQTPLQRALRLLTRREHSRRELSRKLKVRGCPADEVEQVITRLAEEGWQSDHRFADNLLRARANAGYGPRYIRAELTTHGLSNHIIETAFQRFDSDWSDIACALLRRRFAGNTIMHDIKQRRKASDLLTRRGFDGHCIQRALDDTER